MFTNDAVRAFLSAKQARGLAGDTIRWYLGILQRFSTQFSALPDTPESIEGFLSGCHLKDERRHGYYRALRAFYGFLARRYGVGNPVGDIEPPVRKHKEPRFLMPGEIYQLLIYPHKPKVRAALLFLIDTGCRVGELHNLKARDIKQTPWGYVAMVTGKTGERTIPISDQTHTALMATLPFGWSKWYLRVNIKRAFVSAGLSGSSKTLRHTFGSLWAGDISMLQRIMGHSSINTTQIYRHLWLERLATEHHKYSPLQFAAYDRQRML